MELDELQKTWNELGARDAMWAVLSGPNEASRTWDPEAFFRTGREEIAFILSRLRALGVEPALERALDFGCGIGRLSRALAEHVAEVHGVDIAESMLEQARAINRGNDRIRFHLNEASSLALFPDAFFDVIYTSITLQHMEPRFSRLYLAEFFRVIRPGGAVIFQIPDAPVPIEPVRTQLLQPLPIDACYAVIEPPASELRCAPRSPITLRVHVRNASRHLWPALGHDDGALSIRLGNHWLNSMGWMRQFDDVRAGLHEDVPPDGEAVFVLPIVAPEKPGVHLLELDLVQEQVRWFAQTGSGPARVKIRVDRSLPPGTVEGMPRHMEMYGIPKPDVYALVTASGGRVLAADPDDAPGPGWTSYRYYTVKE